ncbi:MAG: 4-alpha-glucanotransferase [Kofleriaceae bacterium]
MELDALDPGLAALCAELGVDARYLGWDGRTAGASVAAVLEVIAALGVVLDDAGGAGAAAERLARARWEEPLEPVLVCWVDGAGGTLDVAVRTPAEQDGVLELDLELEAGGGAAHQSRLFDLPADGHAWPGGVVHCVRHCGIPVPTAGYHRLRWRLGEAHGEALVVAAPRHAHRADGDRRWGLFAPTYALRTAASGGAGDLRELARLARLTADAGGRFVGTLPLLAANLDEPCEPSPYAPVSRMAWNELYLDLPRAAEAVGTTFAAACAASGVDVDGERARLHALPLIDYRAQYAWRRRVIDHLAEVAWAQPTVRPALEAFAQRPHARGYALFRAVGEARRQPWPAWPAALQVAVREALVDGALAADALGSLDGRDLDRRARAHLFAQWAMDAQLGALTADTGCGLYLDLPVGVGGDAYDAFAWPELFVGAVATGAPPDALFLGGQDWGLPPLHPRRIRDSGWRYVIDMVRHHMARATMLRIDHVMGLHRLYWVPRGRSATEGVYVRYPADELWAILCLESQRCGCELVGEDLGVVPPEVPAAMVAHGVRGLAVRQFALPGEIGQAPLVLAEACVASLGTHDTPTFAAHWRGDDVDVLVELGLVNAEQAAAARQARARTRAAVLAELAGQGLVEPALAAHPEAPAAEAAALHGLHRQLAAGPARDVMFTVEDLWLEPTPQNVPGTGPERPNWCRPHARSLDAWAVDPALMAQLAELDRARRG